MATLKQKLAFKEVGVNGGIISKAMVKAGYASSTSKRTDKLTQRKGWKELVDKFISDEKLAKVHSEGLEAVTYYTEGLGKGETVLVEKPDFAVRHRYLDTGYKIRGRLNPEVERATTVNNYTQIVIHPPHGTENT